MTSNYEQLATIDPVFGQLRNCMDLAVVAALVAKQRNILQAREAFPLLTGEEGQLAPLKFTPPKEVSPGASLSNGRHKLIIAGGVQVNPWAVIEKTEKKTELTQVHTKSVGPDDTSWWWD